MQIASYGFIALTMLLTIYTQIVAKWRALEFAPLTNSKGRLGYLIAMCTDPWLLSACLAAGFAALSWLLAIERIEVSRANAIMALIIALIPLTAAVFLNERLAQVQWLGILLIVAGIALVEAGAR